MEMVETNPHAWRFRCVVFLGLGLAYLIKLPPNSNDCETTIIHPELAVVFVLRSNGRIGSESPKSAVLPKTESGAQRSRSDEDSILLPLPSRFGQQTHSVHWADLDSRY